MLAYISVNGSALPGDPAFTATSTANPDTYNSVVPCATAPCVPLNVSTPAKGVIANDVNVFNVKVLTAPTQGTLILNPDGTFVYTPNAGWSGSDSFIYMANGNAGITCSGNVGCLHHRHRLS